MKEYAARAYSEGQAMIISVLFFLVISIVLVFGVISPVVTDQRIARDIMFSRQGYYVAEAGVEDILYRGINGMDIASPEVLSFSGHTATTTITNVGIGTQRILSKGDAAGSVRKIQTDIKITSGTSFNFGIQVGKGGLRMENTSSIEGNVYANGSVVRTGTGLITGGVVSAGPTGLVDDIEATGDVHAHTIRNSDIGGDAYYQVITGSSVAGTPYPGSPDQATTTFPISDDQIESWKADAEEGIIISSPCPYVIDTDTTIGPAKITCDLIINDNPVVTLTGVVWVEGSINISNGPTIRIDPFYAGNSTGFIADKESNRTTSSKIDLNNTAVFDGSGDPDSYVLLISQNESAELGGSEWAVDVANTVNGKVVIYASHGEIRLDNNADVRQLTAHTIRLRNSATLIYETGLISFLFSSGPGGTWAVSNWREVP